MAYRTFTRTWWNAQGEPEAGRRTWYRTWASEEAARKECREWNAAHDPGPRSRKMEYTEV